MVMEKHKQIYLVAWIEKSLHSVTQLRWVLIWNAFIVSQTNAKGRRGQVLTVDACCSHCAKDYILRKPETQKQWWRLSEPSTIFATLTNGVTWAWTKQDRKKRKMKATPWPKKQRWFYKMARLKLAPITILSLANKVKLSISEGSTKITTSQHMLLDHQLILILSSPKSTRLLSNLYFTHTTCYLVDTSAAHSYNVKL